MLSWINRTLRGGHTPIRKPTSRFKPWVETLEDRFAPAIFNVTVLTDAAAAPAGSLRAAIDGLIAAGNTDTSNQIRFAANLSGTINLVQALPTKKMCRSSK